MDQESQFNQQNKDQKPPFNCHMSRYKIPVEESNDIHVQLIKQLIGNSGRYFIHLTQDGKLRYLWYDRHTKSIDIWGQESRIPKCIKKIELRIYKILNKMFLDNHQLKSETIQWMENYSQNFQKF